MSDQHASQAIPGTSAPDQAGKAPSALQRALSKLGWVGGEPSEAAQIALNTSTLPQDASAGDKGTPTPTPEATKGSEGIITQTEVTNQQASKQFAALARQEKAIRALEAQVKAEKAAIEQARAALPTWKPEEVTDFEQYRALKGSKKYDEALRHLGLTYEELTEYQLTGKLPEKAPESAASKELADFKAELRQKEENQLRVAQEAQKQAYDKALEDFRKATNEFILTNKDKYELIDIHAAQEVVLAVIETNYQRSVAAGQPRVMTIAEAADLVEADLQKRIEASLASKKLSAKGKSPEAPATSSQPTKEQQARTLTNAMTASTTPSTPARNEKDRVARALAALSKK